MISRDNDGYLIVTGNYIANENVTGMKNRLDEVNALTKDELKDYYKQILNNGEMSLKGGGGLGMIDIARKTGQKLGYNFERIDEKVSFFSLNIRVSQV
jgi:hypothetical protein